MTEHSGGHALREDLERRVDEYRELLLASVNGLGDDDAKAVVVPGQPCLLGILRHVAFVEGVWFEEALTGRSRKEIGMPVTVANSLKARAGDTVESVRSEYLARCAGPGSCSPHSTSRTRWMVAAPGGCARSCCRC